MARVPVRNQKTTMNNLPDRKAIIDTCLRLNHLGLNQGAAGNISLRLVDRILITPTGMPYDEMRPSDLVEIKLDGTIAAGQRKPSSEWRFHVDLHNTRPGINCVIHAHAPFCTALACQRLDIPAFHYMVAVAGGDSIRCAPYATFGTQDLSEHVTAALQGRSACLLANHGMIALGEDLKQTLALAVEVETLATQYWRTLQIGAPAILNTEQMSEVLGSFTDYGQTQ